MSNELTVKVHPKCGFTERQIRNFLAKLQPQENGCYYWLGARCGDYGRLGVNDKGWPTHRFAWVLVNGPIPKGKIVCHKCDTPICCNWEHLEVGTYRENSMHIWQRGRGNAPRGERQGMAKVTLQQVSDIKTALNEGTATQPELARRYGVHVNTIHAIRMELSWPEVEPRIKPIIPTPNRKLTEFDYVDIRDKWRTGGWKLKTLAESYGVRIDTIQKIIDGRRGTSAPVGERAGSRKNQHKLGPAVRQEMLRRYLAGETQISLAREYGMSKNGINLMLQRLSA